MASLSWAESWSTKRTATRAKSRSAVKVLFVPEELVELEDETDVGEELDALVAPDGEPVANMIPSVVTAASVDVEVEAARASRVLVGGRPGMLRITPLSRSSMRGIDLFDDAPLNVTRAFSEAQLRFVEEKRPRTVWPLIGMLKFVCAPENNLGRESPTVASELPLTEVVVQPAAGAMEQVAPVKPFTQRH